MFLDEALLRRLGRDEENGLPSSFLDEALAEGDECFGFLDGETLAAYGWYSRRPTPIDPPDLVLDPGDRYVYMYKGFTHPAHRGKRLHAIGMTLALQHYQRRGYRGLISYVESNNFSSLNSVRRMGYEIFGSVWALRVFGMHLTHAGAGWKQHGARIEPAERGPVTRAGALAGAARR
jgi:ribosomal protein S18 acetylase RimI-like enzyme